MPAAACGTDVRSGWVKRDLPSLLPMEELALSVVHVPWMHG